MHTLVGHGAGEREEEVKKFGFRVFSACFTPDGTRALTASQDDTATVWDIEDDVIIDDNVIIKDGVVIKKGTKIGPGCVIGSSGLEVKDTIFGKIIISHKGVLLLMKM